jgi:hypothetical protein
MIFHISINLLMSKYTACVRKGVDSKTNIAGELARPICNWLHRYRRKKTSHKFEEVNTQTHVLLYDTFNDWNISYKLKCLYNMRYTLVYRKHLAPDECFP